MNNHEFPDLTIDTDGLRLLARAAPWDGEIYGVNVAQIQTLTVHDATLAARDFSVFKTWCKAHRIAMVSSRLPHTCLRESFFLEDQGFRFIEMVLHPRLALSGFCAPPDEQLMIAKAGAADLDELVELAECAFGYERYHVDPRLDPRLADRRYGRWVRHSLQHASQRLLKVTDGARIIALFIIEAQAGKSIYWHLTAISPNHQGQGYGHRVWQKMLLQHKIDGFLHASTTIAARNVPVLNLYAKLQFRFDPPEMTFHWIEDLQTTARTAQAGANDA
jgi:GNAT superfamily N-acetyltransferase